jgi:hypothetical protein
MYSNLRNNSLHNNFIKQTYTEANSQNYLSKNLKDKSNVSINNNTNFDRTIKINQTKSIPI